MDDEFIIKFPSMMERNTLKRYVHLFEEGGPDDCSGHPNLLEGADYVDIGSVEKHLTDNQRIRDAFKKMLEAGTYDSKGYFVVKLHDINEAKKELGLDK